MSSSRRPVIAVCGAGASTPALDSAAEAVGRLIAEAGAVLVCGGLGGVMAAAARGAAEAGGLTIGILPGRDAGDANSWISVALPTGMGEGRNVLVVRCADAVIAVGGEWGTLSEVALAMKIGRPVVLLEPSPATARLGIEIASDPRSAVRTALAATGSSQPQPWDPPPTSP